VLEVVLATSWLVPQQPLAADAVRASNPELDPR